MNKLKEVLIGLLIVIVIGSLVILVYRSQSGRVNRELAKRIAEVSPKGGPPETIEGLRQAIAIYEEQIERNVREGAQTGIYWKILGIRLADKGMHNDALHAFERAIYYNTDEPVLYYLTGISAATVAKSIVGFSGNAQREHFNSLSENAYLRAIDLDNTYTRPMYGLSILYVFELDRPQDAVPHLERLLSIQSSNIDAMFVLARAYFMTERYKQAIEVYDKIITGSKDKKYRRKR